MNDTSITLPPMTNDTDLPMASEITNSAKAMAFVANGTGVVMASTANVTYQEGELFTWHGTELIVLPMMMVLGIAGNLLVFYIYHFRWRSNTVTLFKRMLAVLDLCNLVLALPSLLYTVVNPGSDGFQVNCIFMSFVALSTAIASGCLLVIIAADRFMKLCLLRKTGIGTILAKKLFAVSVIIACLLDIPTVWLFGMTTVVFKHYQVQVSYCFIKTESKNGVIFYVYIAMLSLVFMAVMAALFVLYAKVIIVLRRLAEKHDELKRRPSLAGGAETLKRQKQTEVMQKSAVVFIAITVVFFASYAPYFVTMIISMLDQSVEAAMSPGLKAIYDLAKLSPLANNVANPFIYSFTSEHFREEVKNIFTFKACEKGFFRRRAFSFSRSDRSKEISEISDSREQET
uniref:G-protein coupled receptors family 1 profile domain-containing protein n=1 Tax=Biomphalaria glabrata TaxID=6526 RepID=A0A2C9LCK2_BIOGL